MPKPELILCAKCGTILGLVGEVPGPCDPCHQERVFAKHRARFATKRRRDEALALTRGKFQAPASARS